ncbi:beta-carotene 15,15'-monooxygenase [Streptococcus sp. HMSC071D03]|uniref:hypothetical protein n=1 Tax=Streptococcus TaxID=1301 RepID=UPI00066A3D2F|nr:MULTISPECIES: hypothetical protein [Streptococcus]OFK00185.1 beta-carotene 15,15'-monooxygenase [Streptococcus sp. HMSC071D03]
MLIIKKLLDLLNSFTKKCNTLYLDYDKNQKKKAQERFDALKVLRNKDYIIKNVSSKTKQNNYFVRAIVATVIMLVLFFMIMSLDSSNNLFSGFCSIFILSLSLSYAYNSFIVFLLSLNRYFRKILFSILTFINVFILGDIIIRIISNANNPNRILNFFENLFKEYELQTTFGSDIWLFWLIFTLMLASSCLSLYFVLKTQDVFELELMGIENRLLLSILAIVTFIIGIDIEKVRLIGILCLILVIQTAFFEASYSYLLSRMYEKAQTIFQEQLLLKFPDYQELKKCYYCGGEKYREKLLSTEKFLEVIIKNEFKSLNDLKNYDDYKLYKSTR